MSEKTKNISKTISKIFGAVFFFFLFTINIQTISSTEKPSDGTLSLFGIEISLDNQIYAKTQQPAGHWVYWPQHDLCRCEPISIGDTWECTGLWSWSTC